MCDRTTSRIVLVMVGMIALVSVPEASGQGAGLLQRNDYRLPAAKDEEAERGGEKPVMRAVPVEEEKPRSPEKVTGKRGTGAVAQGGSSGKTGKEEKADAGASGKTVPPTEGASAVRATGSGAAWMAGGATATASMAASVGATAEPLEGVGNVEPVAVGDGASAAAGNGAVPAVGDGAAPAAGSGAVPAVGDGAAPVAGSGEVEKPRVEGEGAGWGKAPAKAGGKGGGFVSWRKRYELGPGDVLTFSFAGRPDLLREAVKISPEGTVSYLQAVQVKATGKTVDELREGVNDALAAYHKSPRVIITPVTVGSKRYTIMGQVRQSGTFALDRPMSLLEAIAKSAGIQVGLSTSETVELADLDRSFLVRGDRKMPVDFAKLYLDGDLSQNLELEPNDYIYIASNLRNEFYLLGAVQRQGTQQLASRMTVAGAIASASGFTDKAWRNQVLLVRGSIHKPETTVVNVNDILKGKAKDIVIQPRDIIYVHNRPWAFVEEILDNAIKDFLSAASVSAIEKYGGYGSEE